MNNIKLVIEYDGTNYCGWQRQKNGITVQELIEKSLFKITNEKISINGAGRTDAGVHARGQVATFKTNSMIPPSSLSKVINQKLPNDIKCISSEKVDDDFHARFSSTGKHYRYIILNREVKPTIKRNHVEHIKKKLNVEAMKKAIKIFEGVHNFRGFMSTGSNIKNTVREIYQATIKCEDDEIIIDIKGNGFLYNMVRIIVGTLIFVGLNKIPVTEIRGILKSKNRQNAGKTAKACGLYLIEVFYT